MGTILEREAAYKDASDYYYKAWTYGNKNQLNVGFKLAFNYLKDKKYIQAIDIAHYVIYFKIISKLDSRLFFR